MKRFLLLIALPLFYGCGNGPNGSVVEDAPDSLSIALVDTSYVPKNLIGDATLTRVADQSQPPVEIDLSRPNSSYVNFDLADYFTRAVVKVLNFPADSGSFVYDRQIAIRFNGGMQLFDDKTAVRNIDETFLVFDQMNGIFAYDSLGNYLGTIYKNKLSGLKYNKRYKWDEIELDRWNSCSVGHSIQGNVYYLIRDSLNRLTLKFWNVKQKKDILERVIKKGHPMLLPKVSGTLYYSYNKTALQASGEHIMLYFFNEKGDTLGKVPDYIQLKERLKGSYCSAADNLIQYNFEGNGYIRQPYSDTLFKIVSPKEIRPAYLVQFGDKKPTIDIGYYGDKSNYFMLQSWAETKDVILICYSKNYDCIKTRAEKNLSFYYAVYDKKSGKLSYLTMKEAYPEQAWMTNTLSNSLPVAVSQFVPSRNGKIYIRYFKEDLDNMIQSAVFKSFSSVQQETIQKLAAELGPRKIAVMTLE